RAGPRHGLLRGRQRPPEDRSLVSDDRERRRDRHGRRRRRRALARAGRRRGAPHIRHRPGRARPRACVSLTWGTHGSRTSASAAEGEALRHGHRPACARRGARLLKHDYIGAEHVLLGLLREEEGVAADVLASLDVTVEEVRAQVARIVRQGDGAPTGQMPFAPRARKVLELALREALSLGHDYIATEHILLGLVRENEGIATRIL